MYISTYINSSLKLFSILIISCACSIFPASAKGEADNNVFNVVIDAGHGGKDFGAVDNNVKEKDINLSVAKKLASKIKKGCKDVNVIMTRDNDSFITLQDRAKIANDNKGNLFISIHTNSVDKSNPRRTTVAGASVYALGLHKDQSNLQVAMRENSVIELEKNFEQKYSGFDPSKDESYIIFEMAQKKNLGQSLKFADLAQKNLVNIASRGDRGVKQAGFWVLWATSMPAVLVELDFICNPNSAIYMGSEKGQEQMAEALYKAFEKYLNSFNARKNYSESTDDASDIQESLPPDQSMPIVASSRRIDKQISDSKSDKSYSITKRRRRSDAAKKLSISRNVETASIPLHSENDRLPELSKEEKPVMVAATPVQSDDSQKKNSKKKKSNKKTTATYNNKTVAVNKNETAKADNNSGSGLKHHQSISGYHSRVQKLKTVYKIQILACDELLKQDNPQFHGLTPVKSFKERNLYKYTYGESESRQEMESLLKKVKQMIPDAFIIKSMK